MEAMVEANACDKKIRLSLSRRLLRLRLRLTLSRKPKAKAKVGAETKAEDKADVFQDDLRL